VSRIEQAWTRHLRAGDRLGAPRPERSSPLAQYPLEQPSSAVAEDAPAAPSAADPVAPPAIAAKPAVPAVVASPPDLASPFIRSRQFASTRGGGSRLPAGAPTHAAECARILPVLQDAHAATNLRSVMVTGASSREDTAVVGISIARALSEVFPRVLLVDADTASPWLHRSVNVPLEPGLCEWAEGCCQAVPIVEITPHLCVLTAGRMSAAPSSDATADQIDAVLDVCTSTFDFVVLCTPPVNCLEEARRIARRSRAVLFVISTRTPFSESERAKAALDRSLIIATVLNGVG
jgi:Mrp family chromosome partitioning ATPase